MEVYHKKLNRKEILKSEFKIQNQRRKWIKTWGITIIIAIQAFVMNEKTLNQTEALEEKSNIKIESMFGSYEILSAFLQDQSSKRLITAKHITRLKSKFTRRLTRNRLEFYLNHLIPKVQKAKSCFNVLLAMSNFKSINHMFSFLYIPWTLGNQHLLGLGWQSRHYWQLTFSWIDFSPLVWKRRYFTNFDGLHQLH